MLKLKTGMITFHRFFRSVGKDCHMTSKDFFWPPQNTGIFYPIRCVSITGKIKNY